MKNNIIDKIAIEMSIKSTDDFIPQIQSINDLELVDRDGRTLLINAAFYGYDSVISWLIGRGANINASDRMGNTAVHMAIYGNNLSSLIVLLENGANVNQKNEFGNTPIWIAKPSQLDIIKMLLEYGANPKIVNNYGVSAYDSMLAYPEIIKLYESF